MSVAPRHKHLFWVSFLCFMVLVLSFAAAQAAELAGLQFSLEADPNTMTKPGKVTLTAKVANSGQTDIVTPIALYDAQDKLVPSFFDGGSLAGLKVGESRMWTGEAEVTQAQLDAGKLIYTIKANVTDPNGVAATMSFPAEAKITYIGEKVDLSILRVISPEIVRKDDMVTVRYTLKNMGNIKLTDIRIREHSSISGKPETVKELDAGQEAVIKFEKKVSTADLNSHPNITYKKQGSKEVLKATLDNVVVPIARPKLTLKLSTEQTMVNIGDPVTLKLSLVNEGNITYTGAKVTDKKLGEVFTNVDIPAKQTVELTREVIMQESASFQFDVELNDNTGKKQTEKTNEVKVSAYDPAQMVRLSLVLTPEAEAVPAVPYDMGMTLSVTNNSEFDVKDIKILHGGTAVTTLGNLAKGQTVDVTRRFRLSTTGKFQFNAKVVDSQKNTQTFLSNEVRIDLSPATPTPPPLATPYVEPVVTYSPVPASYMPQNAGLGTVLLVLTTLVGVAFLGALGLFAASTITRERLKRQSKIAYDSIEIKPKTDEHEAFEMVEEAAETAADEAEELPVAVQTLPHEKYLQDAPKNGEAVEEKASVVEEKSGYTLTREDAFEGEVNPDAYKRPAGKAQKK